MVREELLCVIHSMSPSTLGESGGGAHLYYPQCVSLYLGWRRGWGSFALSTVCLLDGDREGLICIIHSVLPLHLGWRWGRGSFASSTVCSLYLGGGGGGAHLYHPQCASFYLWWRWGRGSFVSSIVGSLYLGWRWGRGSFVSSTVCLPLPLVEVGGGSFVSSTECLLLPLVEVGEGLICIIHSVPTFTFGGSGGGAHLYHP